ncbi:MAG: hypothetical protein EA348_12050 [Pseudomonadaceae bacterium]|nr:MAG: hypothetical protein EA348_12050 [Pseudomonadaceae bacterium]
MDTEQLKQRFTLRLIFLVAAPIMLFLMISIAEGFVAALKIVLFFLLPALLLFYAFLIKKMRCPACREPFALEHADNAPFQTTHECRYCGHQVKRLGPINGGRDDT